MGGGTSCKAAAAASAGRATMPTCSRAPPARTAPIHPRQVINAPSLSLSNIPMKNETSFPGRGRDGARDELSGNSENRMAFRFRFQNDIINCSNKDHRGYPGQGVTSNLTCGGPGPGGPGPPQQCVEGAQERGPGAQQFGVFNIPLADNGTAYLYVGIRYGSAPDLTKCREFQYWCVHTLTRIVACLHVQYTY
jgi:hypothetical protein